LFATGDWVEFASGAGLVSFSVFSNNLNIFIIYMGIFNVPSLILSVPGQTYNLPDHRMIKAFKKIFLGQRKIGGNPSTLYLVILKYGIYFLL
jgi:hypothetical protein